MAGLRSVASMIDARPAERSDEKKSVGGAYWTSRGAGTAVAPAAAGVVCQVGKLNAGCAASVASAVKACVDAAAAAKAMITATAERGRRIMTAPENQ